MICEQNSFNEGMKAHYKIGAMTTKTKASGLAKNAFRIGKIELNKLERERERRKRAKRFNFLIRFARKERKERVK